MPPHRFLQCVAALVISLGPATVAPHVAAAAMIVSSHAPAQQSASQVAGPSTASQSPVPASRDMTIASGSPSLGREVFGFALASSLSDPTVGYPTWRFSLLSTVAFFGLHVNWNGRIIADSGWSVWSSSELTNLMTTAHAYGTKVVVTIILQDFSPGTPNMCAGLINRLTTVSETVAQVVAKHADGVNVDYEGLNGTCSNRQTARSMMTDFVHRLRSALPSSSYLSVDTYASSAADAVGFFDVAGMNPYVNAFFVMAYDLEYSNYWHPPVSCNSFCLGPTAPASGYYYNDTTTAAQYVARVPASKVILGIPYYGRVACISSLRANAYPSGSVGAVPYLDASSEGRAADVQPGSYVAHRDANDAVGDGRWDTWYNTSLGCNRELYWDDAVSIGTKYDLVNRFGLRGVGIWTLNYGGGAPELWSELASHFGACRSVAIGATPTSSAPAGTAMSITAAASGCPSPNPLYEFWMMRPGSSTWQLAQAYGTAPTFSWNTNGLGAGLYRFSVFVHDSAGAGVYSSALGRYDAFSSGEYFTLTSIPCTAVTLSTSPSAAAMVGTAFAVTAKASVCPSPLYQFWILYPGSSKWLLAQNYSSATAFNWGTAGKPAGTTRLSVFARDATSVGRFVSGLGRYDAFNSSGHATLTSGCAAVSVSAVPAANVPSGTTATIGGAASGCLNPGPLYEFWVAGPGSAGWRLARGYSATPTFTWSTAGIPTGTYRFAVWVHDSSNTGVVSSSLGRYDAFSAGKYMTVTPVCSSVALSATPGSPAVRGTRITIAGRASGCSPAVYRFWILAPGSTNWQLAQDYSSNATFVWSTTGKPAGAYRFCVWSRYASGPGVYTNGLGSYDSFNTGPSFNLS